MIDGFSTGHHTGVLSASPQPTREVPLDALTTELAILLVDWKMRCSSGWLMMEEVDAGPSRFRARQLPGNHLEQRYHVGRCDAKRPYCCCTPLQQVNPMTAVYLDLYVFSKMLTVASAF